MNNIKETEVLELCILHFDATFSAVRFLNFGPLVENGGCLVQKFLSDW
jgi:hypothetical protein